MTHAMFPASKVLVAAVRAKQTMLDEGMLEVGPVFERLNLLIGFASAVMNNAHGNRDMTLRLDDFAVLVGHWPKKERTSPHLGATLQEVP